MARDYLVMKEDTSCFALTKGGKTSCVWLATVWNFVREKVHQLIGNCLKKCSRKSSSNWRRKWNSVFASSRVINFRLEGAKKDSTSNNQAHEVLRHFKENENKGQSILRWEISWRKMGKLTKLQLHNWSGNTEKLGKTQLLSLGRLKWNGMTSDCLFAYPWSVLVKSGRRTISLSSSFAFFRSSVLGSLTSSLFWSSTISR